MAVNGSAPSGTPVSPSKTSLKFPPQTHLSRTRKSL